MTATFPIDGEQINPRLDAQLGPRAFLNANSQGRAIAEVPDPVRTPFQRDRDRILHASAFRRLAGKMQVVSPQHGDHFRNRLTHTIEVAQIARDLARHLNLNEDLAEAIALAHDLGHPPFGHAGEAALSIEMQRFGKYFEHNEQSLRVVDEFEQRYPAFRGLNLTFEVRQGLDKHQTFFDRPEGTDACPHLEGQLVDVSDEIAYLAADLEDSIRGGFVTIDDLAEVEICRRVRADRRTEDRSTLIRGVMRVLILELVQQVQENLEKEEQKNCSKMVAFAPDWAKRFRELKDFLQERYYFAPEVKKHTEAGQEIVSKIFRHLEQHPDQLPTYLRDSADPLENQITDYIAGMTDRFARDFLVKI